MKRTSTGVREGSTIDLGAEERKIEPPEDLVRALQARPPAWDRWLELSRSHRREHVEAIDEAKKPETRARRIDRAVEMIASRPPKRTRPEKTTGTEPRPRLNAAWHEAHRMPRNATTEQRIAWHQEHEKNCGCRPMPAKLRAMMK